MNSDSDVLSVFQHISNICRQNGGINNLVKKLRQIEVSLDETHTEIIEAIISKVCSAYGISRRQLFNAYRSRRSSEARKMCYVLMKMHVNLNEGKIALFFNRHNKAVYRAWDEFAKMSPAISWQKQFMDRHKSIESQIVLLKKQINQLHEPPIKN